jgi:hypothetical protein
MKDDTKASKPFAYDFIVAVATGRGAVTFWLLFGLFHALFRISYSGTLALDDSTASELVQAFALGYQARQPPLHEWLLWSAQQLVGTGIQSFLLVRYALIAALGYSVFMATRHAVRDDRFAALASLSIAINYQIGWTFHESGTQTILLSIALFCTFDAVVRFVGRASLRHALWLGAAVGLGFLSKHSYPLFLVSLALAVLSLSDLRGKLDVRLLFVSAAVALVLVSPYLVWLAQVGGDVIAASRATLIHEQLDYLTRTSRGLTRFLRSALAFWLPWIVLIALIAPPAFRRAPASAAPPTAAERLAWRTMAIAVALALIGLVAIGATNLSERYMYPLLLIAPIYVFARIDRLAVTDLRIAKLGVLFVWGAIAVLIVRVVSVMDNRVTRTDPFHTLIPFDRLASELRVQGLAEGTAFVADIRIAGNLRATLPGLRVITSDTYRLECPQRRPINERIAFALWTGVEEDARLDALARIKGLPRERIVVPARRTILGPNVPQAWHLVRLDPQAIACARCGTQAGAAQCASGR